MVKRKKARQQVQSYEKCREFDDETYESIPSRHQRAHGTHQADQVSRGRPRVRCGRSQHPDTDDTSLDELAVIRRVARRLYTLNNLGVPCYAQLVIVRKQYPTLAARTRRICQMMSKTIVTTVRNEIRTALPYIRATRSALERGIHRQETY